MSPAHFNATLLSNLSDSVDATFPIVLLAQLSHETLRGLDLVLACGLKVESWF